MLPLSDPSLWGKPHCEQSYREVHVVRPWVFLPRAKRVSLEVDPSTLVKPLETTVPPYNLITASWETLCESHQSSHPKTPGPQKLYGMIAVCCLSSVFTFSFKLLNFGIICYAAIDTSPLDLNSTERWAQAWILNLPTRLWGQYLRDGSRLAFSLFSSAWHTDWHRRGVQWNVSYECINEWFRSSL